MICFQLKRTLQRLNRKTSMDECQDALSKAEIVSSPPQIRRVLRLMGWNAVGIISGLVLIVASGEVLLRLTRPFMREAMPSCFLPKVGLVGKPNAEVRWTNGLDFWTTSRINSLGFLDREPISSERAAESCHITMIGDSFVEAREVTISDKFHVQLEEMAASSTGRGYGSGD